MALEVIGFNEMVEWETVKVYKEYEGVNPVTIRLLQRDYKYIYTYIKKNSPVMANDVFQRFRKMDVQKILYDLRDMQLIYFIREVK